MPVTVSHLPSASTTFAVEVLDTGTAAEGTDYSIAMKTVTFGPTDTDRTKNISIAITDDSVLEPDETIELKIAAADSPANDLGDHYARDENGALATVTIANDELPPAPTALMVTEGDAKLDLSWTAPTLPSGVSLAGYDVHYTSSSTVAAGADASGNDPSAAWVDASHSGTDPEHEITGLDNATEYRLRVRAANAAGASAWLTGTGTPEEEDTTAPTVSSAAVDGASLTVTFSENLAAAANLANSAFEVKKTPASGSEQTVTLSGSPSISGDTVTLTLATAAVHDDASVKVSYTKPVSGSENTLEDGAGNEVASFTGQAVTNNTRAPVMPFVPAASALVSNVGQTSSGAVPLNTVIVAQAFTTGSHSLGYNLASIEGSFNAAGTATGLNVELWSSSSGNPGTKLKDMTVPSSVGSGAVAFAAPSNTTLDAGTTYFVVMYGSTKPLRSTDSDDEDAGAAAGWSIGNTSLYKLSAPESWSSSATSYLIRVNGSAVASLPSELTLSTGATNDTAAEDAGTVTVTATLDNPAGTGGVEVTLTAADASTATATDDYTLPAAFTISEGATSATADVAIVDDDLDEDNETVVLSATAGGLTIRGVTLTIADDDTAGVTLSDTSLTVTAGKKATYTVVLDSKPTANVTVTPTSGDEDKATVSGAVEFTPSNWNEAKTVTVTGVAEGSATVTHAASSTDAGYPSSLSIGSVSVTVDPPDTTAPTVEFAPANGDTVTDADTNIVLTFSEAIRKDASDTELANADLASILTLKTTDDSGTAILYAATINDAKTRITINPNASLVRRRGLCGRQRRVLRRGGQPGVDGHRHVHGGHHGACGAGLQPGERRQGDRRGHGHHADLRRGGEEGQRRRRFLGAFGPVRGPDAEEDRRKRRQHRLRGQHQHRQDGDHARSFLRPRRRRGVRGHRRRLLRRGGQPGVGGHRHVHGGPGGAHGPHGDGGPREAGSVLDGAGGHGDGLRRALHLGAEDRDRHGRGRRGGAERCGGLPRPATAGWTLRTAARRPPTRLPA